MDEVVGATFEFTIGIAVANMGGDDIGLMVGDAVGDTIGVSSGIPSSGTAMALC